MVHVVAYDLKKPNDTGADYARVIAAIKDEFPTWLHLEQSVWVIETTLDAEEARDVLRPYISKGDELFVAALSGNWATLNAGDSRTDWLKKRSF